MQATSPFFEYADEVRPRIEASLETHLGWISDCPSTLLAAIRHSLMAPGKRLRPLLTLLATQACGGTEEDAMPAACAIEMVHTYSLIHDDLPAMDDDDMRRGRPSCHAAFGEATAILAGDALLTFAFEVLARGIEPTSVAAQCVVALSQAAGALSMAGGQADDLSVGNSPKTIDVLESIHRRKTGAMIRAALKMGGIAAGGTENQLASLDEYGNNLGMAFQIVDDLLDHQGDSATLGKSAGKDARQGKLTFPGLLGVAESRRRAQSHIAAATATLEAFEQQAADRLAALARYVVERDH
jgi:geranylgeranyl diphosphate synthase type II